MRSAKTELRSGDERSGSLHPHMAACNFCRSNQDEHEEKKRVCRLFGWRISHGHTLLLPHSGCCYRDVYKRQASSGAGAGVAGVSSTSV